MKDKDLSLWAARIADAPTLLDAKELLKELLEGMRTKEDFEGLLMHYIFDLHEYESKHHGDRSRFDHKKWVKKHFL